MHARRWYENKHERTPLIAILVVVAVGLGSLGETFLLLLLLLFLLLALPFGPLLWCLALVLGFSLLAAAVFFLGGGRWCVDVHL